MLATVEGEVAKATPPAFLLRFAEPRSITLSQSRAIKGPLMKIVSPADSPLIVRMDTVHDAITEPVRRLEVFTEPVGGS